MNNDLQIGNFFKFLYEKREILNNQVFFFLCTKTNIQFIRRLPPIILQKGFQFPANRDPDILLPDNLTVNGDLRLVICALWNNKLPKNLKVRGKLNICFTDIQSLPDDLEADTIIVDLDKVADFKRRYGDKYVIWH